MVLQYFLHVFLTELSVCAVCFLYVLLGSQHYEFYGEHQCDLNVVPRATALLWLWSLPCGGARCDAGVMQAAVTSHLAIPPRSLEQILLPSHRCPRWQEAMCLVHVP